MVWEQSRTARMAQAVAAALARASEGSTLVGAAEAVVSDVGTTIRGSYCYRWLTAEPDPDVVEIDLRKTRTVGPFVRLLERVIGPVERRWSNSGLRSVTGAAGSVVSNSRTGRLLVVLLEPPENERQTDDERG